MTYGKRSIRFWTYHRDGFVRIKIAMGETLHHGYREATDEGWYFEGIRWECNSDGILREQVHDGVDCDGRLTQYHTDFATHCNLNAFEYEGVKLPVWDDVEAHQRDYSAEAMGY
jgi:hypothetical protein